MIVSSGYNISGQEIEEVLLEHPNIRECAVVGVPDLARGQIVKAFVVLRDNSPGGEDLSREIQDFVKKINLLLTNIRARSNSSGTAEDANRKNQPRNTPGARLGTPGQCSRGRTQPTGWFVGDSP